MNTIALIDDHTLVREALRELINRFDGYEVIFDVSSGPRCFEKFEEGIVPTLALVDINMPAMNGFEVAAYLRSHYPQTKVLALTVNDDETSVLKMIQAGAVGYLLKDTEPTALKAALDEVLLHGFYHNELVYNTLLHQKEQKNERVSFQGREVEFLKFACTELTYKEIADQMCLSPRTVDGYRESLFDKLAIRSRVGLAIFAIKNGIVIV